MNTFNVHDAVTLMTSSHANIRFALVRLVAENDDPRSVYQMCLADYSHPSEDATLLQKASDRSFAVEPDRPSLKLCPLQDPLSLNASNTSMITQFTYGDECYQVYAFDPGRI